MASVDSAPQSNDAAADLQPMQPRRERLLSLGGGSALTWRSDGGTATSVPGFSAAGANLPACRDPRGAFLLLRSKSDDVAIGVTEENWLRLAPMLGIADVVTAASTFALLADQSAEGNKTAPAQSISMTRFALYTARIEEKAQPGSDQVGGWMKRDSADGLLQNAGARLIDGERVLIAGGMPSYAIQDMTTTPRTDGSLVLTTHALYWRPSRPWRSKQQLRRFELLPSACEPHWTITDDRAGPLGLGVMDTALRLTLAQQPGHEFEPTLEPEPEPVPRKDSLLGDSSTEAAVVYNFPLHAKHRDAFLLAYAEVIAAHNFAHQRLGCPVKVLPTAVVEAVVGAVVRYRALRGLVPASTVVGKPLYQLPFTVVMAEPPDSEFSTSVVALFSPSSPVPRSPGTTGPNGSSLKIGKHASRPSNEDNNIRDDIDAQDESDNRSEFLNEMPNPRPVRAVSFGSELALRASESVARAVAAHRAKQETRQRAAKSLIAVTGGSEVRTGAENSLPLVRLARVRHNLELAKALREFHWIRTYSSRVAITTVKVLRCLNGHAWLGYMHANVSHTTVIQPLDDLCVVLRWLLCWEQPVVTATAFSTLQFLALTDLLMISLPALIILTVAGHMQLLKHRRRKRVRGGADAHGFTEATSHPHRPLNGRHEHQQDKAPIYHVEYEYRDGSLRSKLTNFNTAVQGLDHIVETLLKALLKLHSAYVGVDESLTEVIIHHLVGFGCVVALVCWVASQLPLYLVLSVALTMTFGACHPLVAPPVESVWVAHGAGAVQVQLSWMLAGALLLPASLICNVADRVLVSIVVSALLLGIVFVVRHSRTGTAHCNSQAASSGNAKHENLCCSTHRNTWIRSKWAELQQCWEMLPAPPVVNTADGTGDGPS